jgi:hypothetical protein
VEAKFWHESIEQTVGIAQRNVILGEFLECEESQHNFQRTTIFYTIEPLVPTEYEVDSIATTISML